MTANLVKDSTDATFIDDVIETSKQNLVLVDFWAPWCGPCRTLGPAIERVVKSFHGKVKLVKINVDENTHFSGQLRVQSIPAVFAFKDGQPVDGFMGAIPESQIKAFIEKHIGAEHGETGIEKLLDVAKECMSLGEYGDAAQEYAQVLQIDPTNIQAITGLAICYLKGGDLDGANETIAMAVDENANNPEVLSVKGMINLATEVQGADDLIIAQNAVKSNPDDLMAKLNLAKSFIKISDFERAIDTIFEILKVELDWNEKAARTLLLKIFDALGSQSELSRYGRRRLSTILFS